MRWIIDRITEGIAVCETADGSYVRVRETFLPAGAKEGSVLLLTDAGFALDRDTEDALREETLCLQDELFH